MRVTRERERENKAAMNDDLAWYEVDAEAVERSREHLEERRVNQPPLRELWLMEFLTMPVLLGLLMRGSLFRAGARVEYRFLTPLAEKGLDLLMRIGVLRAVVRPHRDLYLCDSPWNRVFTINLKVSRALRDLEKPVNAYLARTMPKTSAYFRTTCRASLLKMWTSQAKVMAYLTLGAHRASQLEGIPLENIRVMSDGRWLLDYFPASFALFSGVRIMQPLFSASHPLSMQNAMPLLVIARNMVDHIRARLTGTKPPTPVEHGGAPNVGTTICWPLGTPSLSNFAWYDRCDIPPARLWGLFDRSNVGATDEKVGQLAEMGIAPRAISRKATGGHPELYAPVVLPMEDVVQAATEWVKSLFRAPLTRGIASQVALQNLRSVEIARQVERLGIGVMFHYQEDSLDFCTPAMERIGGIRVGYHWSCFDGPGGSTLRTHHVTFCWGRHNSDIFMDSGAISPHVLINGCPMVVPDDRRFEKTIQAEVDALRSDGAKLVLGVFDGSTLSWQFYRSLLDWLLRQPDLAMMVKSKPRVTATNWEMMAAHGLEGRVEKALATGRLVILDKYTPPYALAPHVDYVMGITTTSAVSLCAMMGARVLFLDYEQLDRDELKPFATLHRLGPERCVFRSMEALEQAVAEVIEDPQSRPELGDASPVVDAFDPFRDGMAGARIGQYVAWYLEAMEEGLDREQAMQSATRRYAEYWGQEYVVRGL
ncbi:MAG: hypothetical protein HQL53_07950 [Magnetococcales bacterium]|nr:hypothetical protein [Magnetococcales bacterium]